MGRKWGDWKRGEGKVESQNRGGNISSQRFFFSRSLTAINWKRELAFKRKKWRYSRSSLSINLILLPGWSPALPLTPAEILQRWSLGKAAKRMQKSWNYSSPAQKLSLQNSGRPFQVIRLVYRIPYPPFFSGPFTWSPPPENNPCPLPSTILVHFFPSFGDQFIGISSEIHVQSALCILSVMGHLHSQTRHVLCQPGHGRDSLRPPHTNKHDWGTSPMKRL